MFYKPFATDKINSNSILNSQEFEKIGDDLVITETYITTINAEQVSQLKASYAADKQNELNVDMDKVNLIQSDLDDINSIYPS